MPNMSYCRFQNTFLALKDCAKYLDQDDNDDLSPEELHAKNNLIALCSKISDDARREEQEKNDTY